MEHWLAVTMFAPILAVCAAPAAPTPPPTIAPSPSGDPNIPASHDL